MRERNRLRNRKRSFEMQKEMCRERGIVKESRKGVDGMSACN